MTEAELRAAVVAQARSWLGCRESDGSHRPIIDMYNSHTPLPRGYAVTYTDYWCATFASAVAIALGLTDIIPPECGCEEQIKHFAALGRWNEDGTIVPQIADYIYYNWDDKTQPNDGEADHVGIVTNVDGDDITLVEGNCDNAVCERTISKGWGYIRGYGQPDYASKAAGVETAPPTSATSGVCTYTVVSGDTLWGIAENLLGDGHRYHEIMSLNGLTSDLIHPGDVLKITELSAEAPQETVSSADTNMYTVVKGDTLWGIADKMLGDGYRYPEIMILNDLTSDLIFPGQVLRIR